jgi:hypothetical protein
LAASQNLPHRGASSEAKEVTGSKVCVNLMDYLPTVTAKPTPSAGPKPKTQPKETLEQFKAKFGL